MSQKSNASDNAGGVYALQPSTSKLSEALDLLEQFPAVYHPILPPQSLLHLPHLRPGITAPATRAANSSGIIERKKGRETQKERCMNLPATRTP
jgi:hypothetical protein